MIDLDESLPNESSFVITKPYPRPETSISESSLKRDGISQSKKKAFTFLRKQSRKEPSAIYRTGKSHADTEKIVKLNQPVTQLQSSETHRIENISSRSKSSMNTMESAVSSEPYIRSVVPTNKLDFSAKSNMSTMSMTIDDWKKNRSVELKDLQEFELLEQQLNEMSLSSSYHYSSSSPSKQNIPYNLNEKRMMTIQEQTRQPTTTLHSNDGRPDEVPAMNGSVEITSKSIFKASDDRPSQASSIRLSKSTMKKIFDNRQVALNPKETTTRTTSVVHSSSTDGFDMRPLNHSDEGLNHRQHDNHPFQSQSPWQNPVRTPTNPLEREYGMEREEHANMREHHGTDRLDNGIDEDLEEVVEATSRHRSGSEGSRPTPSFSQTSSYIGRERSPAAATIVSNIIATIQRNEDDPSIPTKGSHSSSHWQTYSSGMEQRSEEVATSRPVSALKRQETAKTKPHNVKSVKQESDEVVEMQRQLTIKAKELESELEIYRGENATLKKLRRQQELGLSEIATQKEELSKYIVEEKQKVQLWCEEQRDAIAKERRSAAKMMRDTNLKLNGSSVPMRKEKTMIEALQATIEKMKVDHDSTAKKHKANESRLYSLIRDHAMQLDAFQQQIVTLEEQKLQLREFIESSGLRIPKELRKKLDSTPSPLSHSQLSTAAMTKTTTTMGKRPSNVYPGTKGTNSNNSTRYRWGDAGYAEEVDVDEVPIKTSTAIADEPDEDYLTQTTASFDRQTFEDHRDTGQYGGKVSVPLSSTTSRLLPQPRGSEAGIAASTNPFSQSLKSDAIQSGRRSQSATPVNRTSSSSGGGGPSRQPSRTAPIRLSNASLTGSSRSSRYSEVTDEEDLLMKPTPHESTADGNGCNYLTVAGDESSEHRKESNPPDVDLIQCDSAVKQSKEPIVTTTTIPHLTSKETDPTVYVDPSPQKSNPMQRKEEVLPDGKRVIRYSNGTVKEIDEMAGKCLIRFLNGDTKLTDTRNKTVVYYYAQADTSHTTFENGLQIYEFPNQQVEMHYPDGMKEILFPDKTKKIIHQNGTQDSYFPDGVVMREYTSGMKEILSSTDSKLV